MGCLFFFSGVFTAWRLGIEAARGRTDDGQREGGRTAEALKLGKTPGGETNQQNAQMNDALNLPSWRGKNWLTVGFCE